MMENANNKIHISKPLLYALPIPLTFAIAIIVDSAEYVTAELLLTTAVISIPACYLVLYYINR